MFCNFLESAAIKQWCFQSSIQMNYPSVHLSCYIYQAVFCKIKAAFILYSCILQSSSVRLMFVLKSQLFKPLEKRCQYNMNQTFAHVPVSARSDSVMPSTGCVLCHSIWRTEHTGQWKTHELISAPVFFFFCPWFPGPQNRHHLTHKRLLLSLFQSFILTLMELSPFWRGGQGLIRLRMALKVALSSSGHWRE